MLLLHCHSIYDYYLCSSFKVSSFFLFPSSTQSVNPLTPNDNSGCRTAPLTPKRCILYIYSINIGTGYFKRDVHSPFFSLQNAVCFIILTYLVPVLFTFYIFIQQIQVLNILNVVYSPFFSLQNAVCFIILTCLVRVLFTFYIFVQQI